MTPLVPDRIRIEYGLAIKERLIPFGTVWKKTVYNKNDKNGEVKFKKGSPYKADRILSYGSGKAEYVAIHISIEAKADPCTSCAERYIYITQRYTDMTDMLAHYCIDWRDCWQQLREDEVGAYVSGIRTPENEKSIAIKIVISGSGDEQDQRAEKRGALLAAILLKRHHLAIDRLAASDQCSDQWSKDAQHTSQYFNKFKELVLDYMAQIDISNSEMAVKPDKPKPYLYG